MVALYCFIGFMLGIIVPVIMSKAFIEFPKGRLIYLAKVKEFRTLDALEQILTILVIVSVCTLGFLAIFGLFMYFWPGMLVATYLLYKHKIEYFTQ